MKSVLRAACAAVALLSAGCAQPVLDIPEPHERHEVAASNVLHTTEIGPSRPVAYRDMTMTVDRVLPRIRVAAFEICEQLAQAQERCDLMLNARVLVYTDEPDINAFADQRDRIGIFGGLVTTMGTDAEIAAVLAHEFSHVMYGHVQKKMKNALVGMSLAGALAGALAYRTGADINSYGEEWMRAGLEAGSRAYSPSMEIEADRTAIYILHRAGFPASAMRDVIVRMNHAETERGRGPFSGRVGFLQTHPSNDDRIAHILSAIEDSANGVPLKVAGR